MKSRYARQSFLGKGADAIVASATVGVVGLGGGGSHIVQQLAHIGFRNYALFDADFIEDTNLNRLVGGTIDDVAKKRAKFDIAARIIRSLQPDATILGGCYRWQDKPDSLRACDIVFGCVDSFAERRELEVCCRRFLIPLIDIGMDIHPPIENQPPRMAGQVILSMPGDLCMTCLGFLNEKTLAAEAARYGAAGDRPQVVWANGLLASAAVGVAVDLLTDWTRSLRSALYLSYDGNAVRLQNHVRMNYLGQNRCDHFPIDDIGVPKPQII